MTCRKHGKSCHKITVVNHAKDKIAAVVALTQWMMMNEGAKHRGTMDSKEPRVKKKSKIHVFKFANTFFRRSRYRIY